MKTHFQKEILALVSEKTDKDKWIYIIQIITILLLCFLHACRAGHYADFVPINGTFQNYNPIRRFLAGEIPYRDFVDYLGLGHLYAGSFITFLLGNTYRKSLIAFSFLTVFSFSCISLVLGYAISDSKKTACTFTVLFLCLLLAQPSFYVNGMAAVPEIKRALDYALKVGNSARFVRGMVLPVIIFILLCGRSIYQKYGMKQWPEKKRKTVVLFAVSFLDGLAFLWSNDYGISCWLCMILMGFWVILSRERNFFKAAGYAALQAMISVVAIIAFVEVCTWGHLSQWLKTLFGNGNFQSWYYSSSKSFYIYDVDFSPIMLFQAGICIVYLIKIFRSKDGKFRYVVPAFANMVSFCAANEYHLLSGDLMREYALVVVFLTVCFEIVRFITSLLCKRWHSVGKLCILISFLLSFAWEISALKEEVIFSLMTEKEGTYISQMGGNMRYYALDVQKTTDFLMDDKFFSTYASAQEVMTDQFHPSGTDYIIHVLGDDEREKYLRSFRTGNFRYAATIKDEVYGGWVERANWFFYRELYKGWHPVYTNAYEIFWERNETENDSVISVDDLDITVTTERLDKSMVKIVVQAEENVDGIADLYIDYEVKKKDNKSAMLLFNKMLLVENTSIVYAEGERRETNYLRDKNAEYIPVTIVNGYGEVIISSCPDESTYVELYSAGCKEIYTTAFRFIEMTGVKDYDGRTAVCVANTDKNREILNSASKMVMGEVQVQFSFVENEEKIYILPDSEDMTPEDIIDIMGENNILQFGGKTI